MLRLVLVVAGFSAVWALGFTVECVGGGVYCPF